MPFSEFLGNPRVVSALQGALASNRVPHAVLLAGPRGIGKFTLACMFAQAANCERMTDDFCGECGSCRRISQLADPAPLIEQGLAERGESPDAATVERIPLLLQTHPDVWAVVPDPVRLKNPVARPVLHVGQLRAIQHAAYFKPIGRRRVFIVDGADTMHANHSNLFLKVLEEPPETATLILLATNAHTLLPTIRSRCVQFYLAPLSTEEVEQILRARTELPAGERKLAAQISEGRPGLAISLDTAAALQLRHAAMRMLSRADGRGSFADLFVQTAALAKGNKVPFETILEVFYSLLSDLLELSAGCKHPMLRNPALAKELAALSAKVTPQWVARVVRALDELGSRLRRNINRQLGLDAVALSLSERH